MPRILIAALLLAGCFDDEPTLHSVPPPSIAPPSTIEPPEAPPLPPAPSPWELITPGEFPDVYFGVSWSEWPCDDMLDGDGADPNVDGDIWGPCPSNLAVIDLMGQVVAEFEWPGEADDEVPWWSEWNHLTMQQAGPGQFLVVAENWGNDPDEDNDGFWQGTRWQAWIADAVDGSFTEVLSWDPASGYIRITESGRLIPMDSIGTWIHVGVWQEDPDWLLIWGGEGNCANDGAGLTSLTMTHRSRPMDLGRMWSVDELLPEDLAEREGTLWPWAMQSGIDENGDGQLLLGVADNYCMEVQGEHELIAWTPEGISWRTQPGLDTWPMEASFAGWNGGGALTMAYAQDDGTGGRWKVSGPTGVQEGDLPMDRWNYRAGPMLDPAGPTFATLGNNATVEGDVIDIYHQGEKVWSIEELRFGLQPRRVYLRDVVMLPPAY
jgi:hypothetical protein